MKTLSATFALLVVAACGSNPEAASPEGTSDAASSASAAEVSTSAPDAPPPSSTGTTAPSASTATATASATASPPKTKKLALTDAGLALALEAPEDAKVGKSSSKDGLGGALVESRSFSVRVLKADARLSTTAAAKATLQKMANKPAKSFSKEESDLLVYSRGEGEFGFVVLKKVGAVTYACQSLGSASTEAELESAIVACRSLGKAP